MSEAHDTPGGGPWADGVVTLSSCAQRVKAIRASVGLEVQNALDMRMAGCVMTGGKSKNKRQASNSRFRGM